MTSHEPAFRLSPTVLTSVVGHELVLLETSSGAYFGLNEVGAIVWQMLAEQQSLALIEARLVREFDVEAGQVREDVDALLTELSKRKLLIPL